MKKYWLLLLILCIPYNTFAEVFWYTFTSNTGTIVVVKQDVLPSKLMSKGVELLNQLSTANSTADFRATEIYASFKHVNTEAHKYIATEGKDKVQLWDPVKGETHDWEDVYSKELTAEPKVTEAQLLELHPSRSQITPNAWEEAIGDRWMARVSSKRPGYRTYADWILENKTDGAGGAGERIDIHPEDYDRILRDAPLEAFKIYEHNDRFKKGGHLTDHEIGTIMNRDVTAYGVDVSTPGAYVFHPDRFNAETFNDPTIFNARINPYNYEIGAKEKLGIAKFKLMQYDIQTYHGENIFCRAKAGAYYLWMTGIMVAGGVALVAEQILNNIFTINLPQPDLFSVWYRSNMVPIFYGSGGKGLSDADKAQYLKTNPNAWKIKDPKANQPAYSVHCTYNPHQSNNMNYYNK